MKGMPPPERAVALALVAVAAAVAATFAHALFGKGVFFERDILAYWYPGMTAFRRALAQGGLPLWNPDQGFGAPLLADASLQLAYPPTWLVLVVPLATYYKLFAVGHCLWAALGCFVLGRRIGLGASAAAAGGVAFALSGPVLSSISLFHHYAGATWMPWVLAALESLLSRPRLGAAVLLGSAAGAQLLAGSGDLCLATGLLCAARLGWHLLRARRRASLAPLAGKVLLAALLALALGAAQWLPTAEQIARSSRPAQGTASTYWSLHPLSLLDLAVPRLVAGTPVEGAARQALFEGRAPLLAGLYLGVATLVLGALALRLGEHGPRLAAAGAAFFLLASLGRHTPLYHVLSALPGVSLMRYPQKHLLAFSLCTALLAAFGLSCWNGRWAEGERRRAWSLAGMLALGAGLALAAAIGLASGKVVAPAFLGGALDDPLLAGAAAVRTARSAVLLAVLALLLAWRASRERAPVAATAALLLLGAADLAAVGRGLLPLAPRDLVEHRPAVAAALPPTANASRVQFVPPDRDCARVTGGPAGWEYRWRAALAAEDAMNPPSGVRWGIPGAFDGQFTGLEPRWLIPPLVAAVRLAGTERGTRLLQLANVGHVLWVRKDPPAALDPIEELTTPYACPLQLLRVPDPLPGAYTVAGERPMRAGGEELDSLLDPGFDPRTEVLLTDVQAPETAGPPPGAARVLTRTSNTVDVETSAGGAGVLVLVEAFDEGWHASVDGKQAPVVRANVLFRGVRIGAGRHRVRFVYRPWTARLGLGLFSFGLLAAAGLGLVARRASIRSAREEARP
jgi:Bacterial membrane protein YfhO